MSQPSNTNTNNAKPKSPSPPPSQPLFNPPPMSYDDVDETFADSNQSFTALISRYCDDPIINTNEGNRKRCRVTLLEFVKTQTQILTKRMTAYFFDEWRDLMHKIWTNDKVKQRDIAKISITFYAMKVCPIPKADIDPLQHKQCAFIVDSECSTHAWVEFKTCVNRICGTNGLRFDHKSVPLFTKEKLKKLPKNGNSKFLTPQYAYTPISELSQFNKGYLFGYVSFAAECKACHAGKHNWSKQIRIRDCSLPWDSDDLQIMCFANDCNEFPNVTAGDLLRLHRVSVNHRTHSNQFQIILSLDRAKKPPQSFIVIDGNLLASMDKRSVKHSSSNKYTFDGTVDSFMIAHLRQASRVRMETFNGPKSELTIPMKALSEISASDARVNLMVLITDKMEIASGDSDKIEFYWLIWDGSEVSNALMQLHFPKKRRKDSTEIIDICEEKSDGIECNYKNPKIIGSFVKLLVSPDYETGILCWNADVIGKWCEFTNILCDSANQELVFDKLSKFDTTNVDVRIDGRIHTRLESVCDKIYKNTKVKTTHLQRHCQYQSYSNIKSVTQIRDIHCRYLIRGQCVRYYPNNIELFSKKSKRNNTLQFVLFVKDASESVIKVIFCGKEAKLFFGIGSDENVLDLSDARNRKQLEHIGHCMETVMSEDSILDICIRSYKVEGKELIAYKGFDTVLTMNE